MKSLLVKVVVVLTSLVAMGALLRSVSYAIATRREEPLYGPADLGMMIAAALTLMVLAFAAIAWQPLAGREEGRPR